MPRAPHFLASLLDEPDTGPVLMAAGRAEPIATHLEAAFDSASRTRGLLGRTSLPDGHALVIAPCYAIHTIGMRFPIDVIYATRDGRVLKVRSGIQPNRMSAALGAFAVIELPAGTIARTGVARGDRLGIAGTRTGSADHTSSLA